MEIESENKMDDESKVPTFKHKIDDDTLYCKKIVSHAKVPCRSDTGDAGYDMFACFRDVLQENRVQWDGRTHWATNKDTKELTLHIPSGARGVVGTGITVSSVAIFQLWSSFDLARRKGIDVLGGLIGRNEVVAIIINHGQQEFVVHEGDKICQLVSVSLQPKNEMMMYQCRYHYTEK
jgi:dUTPase